MKKLKGLGIGLGLILLGGTVIPVSAGEPFQVLGRTQAREMQPANEVVAVQSGYDPYAYARAFGGIGAFRLAGQSLQKVTIPSVTKIPRQGPKILNVLDMPSG